VTVHGHFYQPPRENPWLEVVEAQDSAAPWHDWNERITEECYAPNGAARRVDDDNRIRDIVNNYEKISFNVGPTLCAWLERRRPDVFAQILTADRRSRQARGGHGNAIAQVYNHAIMPLCTRRDKVTQVRWGIADFRHRFGRDPEGVWLAETAVDGETLAVLAEAGIRFTILAPHQARRVRPLDGDGEWLEIGEQVDPSRAYRWRAPGGATLALFFYDGPISRAIAFGDALSRGEALAERLRAGLSDERAWPQLVHCATDGESYGHHARFGDMALAAALEQVEREGFATLTNYGAFLAAHPPTHEVEIAENTSWSCAHGIERWRADCGCRTRSGWHQRWRGPLRETLDWLRDQVDLLFERRAAALFGDPWAARDDYVDLVLDRSPEARARFLARHARRPLGEADRVAALQLLELQRQRLLMYTSCGWFFDEISGIEAVQVLKYAALAIQYVRSLDGGALEAEFLRRLARAPSNVPELGDGAGIYRALVRPAVVDPRRVVAHYAISSLFEGYGDATRIETYTLRRLDEQGDTQGGTALRIGHVRVRTEVTGAADEATYAVLHHRGHDFHCGVGPFAGAGAYDAMAHDLRHRYTRGSLSDTVRALDRHFPGEPFTLRDLFVDEQQTILAWITAAALERDDAIYRRIWDENRTLAHYLARGGAPVPEVLRALAGHVLSRDLAAGLADIETKGVLPEQVVELADEARALGIALDLGPAGAGIARAVEAGMEALAAEPTPDGVRAVLALIEGAERLGVGFGLWRAQNRFFEIWQERPERRTALQPLGDRLGFSLE
jgi:alpha-amylase/alpha-mannosidase (GH57 family)